jgi:hypothetical protein
MLQPTAASITAELRLFYAGQDALLTVSMLSQRVVPVCPSLIVWLVDSHRPIVL